jgi:iron complex transport system substrate-binding protein
LRALPILLLALLVSLVSACSTAPAAPPTPQPPAKPAAAPTAAPAAQPKAAPAAQPTSAPAAKTEPAPAFPITITDDAGRQVTIAKQPQRIVSLAASNTEIVYALGLGDKVVGVDKFSNYPPEAQKKPVVGSYSKPDLEQIVAAEPDLILATGIHVKSAVPEMEKHNLPVVVVTPKDVATVLSKIELVGKITGRQKEAEALTGEMRAKIDALQTRAKGAQPVRVFFELSPELHSAGAGTFVNDMITMLGGVNIAAGAGQEWPQMNQESIFVADPEVILLADHGTAGGQSFETVAARPGWHQLDAVKNKRVHEVDPDLTNRPGPRLVEGLEAIIKALHPNR